MKRALFSLSALFVALFLQGCSSTSRPAEESFPNTVAPYVEHIEQCVHETVAQLATTPHEGRSFENTMRPWVRLGDQLICDLGVLHFLMLAEAASDNLVAQAIEKIGEFFNRSIAGNAAVYRALLQYADLSLSSGEALAPYEAHLIQEMLNHSALLWADLPAEEQQTTLRLRSLNLRNRREPFHYLAGECAEKEAAEGAPLTVLTLNTCFLPGKQPLFYGGMRSWQERVEGIAERVISTGADLICLQEVFEEEAGLALYEKLKNHYAHFYVAIAPRLLGFALHQLGLSSGLFVASRYPLESPLFTLYPSAAFQMNYGVFDFVVRSKEAALAHVYTTHLQPLDLDTFPEVRAQQLQHLLEKMRVDVRLSREEVPYFVCGDMNIPWGSEEPGERLIREHFFDAYNNGRKEVTERDATCTDFYTNRALYPEEERESAFEILDYALLLHSLPAYPGRRLSDGFQIESVKVITNSLDAPEDAITDHHGILTTIQRG